MLTVITPRRKPGGLSIRRETYFYFIPFCTYFGVFYSMCMYCPSNNSKITFKDKENKVKMEKKKRQLSLKQVLYDQIELGQILSMPLAKSVTLSKLFFLSESQCPHLYNENKKRACWIQLR